MPPVAHHIIFAAYGFWLPNDPRGSWSTYVGSDDLYRSFGAATKVATRESLAKRQHDHGSRLAAKRELKSSPAVFTGRQALEIARAVGDLAVAESLVVLACAVMPDHVHLVVRSGPLSPVRIVASCKSRASRRLHESGLWPPDRRIWARGKWVVHLNTEEEIRRAVRYVERNPIAAGLKRQRWSFVQPLEHRRDT
ncbi:MAG: hypothetical protein DWQ37_01200 [Planctomycetota bacterium]|nr:MAG: hypothetical protein DWQ37_01200 [Planctomycetota bacterium]